MFGKFQQRVQDWFGRLKINAGTAKAPALEIAQTWNDPNYAYTGIKENITNTDSASDSLLMDLQSNGITKFNINKLGTVSIGSSTGPKLSLDGPYLRITLPDTNYLLVRSDTGVHTSLCFAICQHNSAPDVFIIRDGIGIFALRNGGYTQTFRLYSNYSSETSYHRLAMTCAKQTLSNVSGATVATTGGLIPNGAYLIGVTTRINTALGTGNGTTGYTVGDGSDADLWGVAAAVTLGTATKSSDYTAADASGILYTAAGEVTITATGGNFDATGVIEVSAFYFLCEAD